MIAVSWGAPVLPVLSTFRFATHGVLRQHIPLGLGSASRLVVALSCRPSVRPSVCPAERGAVAGGLPPGSSLLPRFPARGLTSLPSAAAPA